MGRFPRKFHSRFVIARRGIEGVASLPRKQCVILRRLAIFWLFAAAPLAAIWAEEASAPSDVAIRLRAEALLHRMTIQEKAAQLINDFRLPRPRERTNIEQRIRAGVGSVRFVTDPTEVNRLQGIVLEQSRLRIPLIFGIQRLLRGCPCGHMS